MTAFGVSFPSRSTRSICSLRELGSILNVYGLISQNTGVAPVKLTTSAVAKKVKPGTNTASPSWMPQAISGISRASVPLETVTQYFRPV